MKANGNVYQKTGSVYPMVLFVEADEDTRLMMSYLLQIWKFRIVESTGDDEREVLELAEINQPDLILISSRNRTDDDLALVRRLRGQAEFIETGIIYISGFSEPSARAAAVAAGADGFLSKPINFGQLETMLKRYEKKRLKSDGVLL